MSLEDMVNDIKNRPGYTENCGMLLVHNGTVRAWSRKGHKKVFAVEVTPDEQKMGAICQEMGSRPGIFAISANANQGLLKPGDDLLTLVVAGDLRENVLNTMTELLNRIKSEAVSKREFLEGEE